MVHIRQRSKRNYYLSMKHMNSFTDTTLNIANAWLDPEVQLFGKGGTEGWREGGRRFGS